MTKASKEYEGNPPPNNTPDTPQSLPGGPVDQQQAAALLAALEKARHDAQMAIANNTNDTENP